MVVLKALAANTMFCRQQHSAFHSPSIEAVNDQLRQPNPVVGVIFRVVESVFMGACNSHSSILVILPVVGSLYQKWNVRVAIE